MTIEHKRSSKGEIEDLIKARYSLIWITSPEENRVEVTIAAGEKAFRDQAATVSGTSALSD